MATMPEQIRAMGLETSTHVAEIAAGGAAAILAILGLAHTFPSILVAVATLAVALAVMFAGASVSVGYRRLMSTAGEGPLEVGQIGGGMSAEMTAGVAGLVLGVLALLNIASVVLSAIAVIVFGSALLIGRSAATRLKDLEIESVEQRETARRVAEEAVATAMGTQTLVGLGAVILGILALVGIKATILTLVALLTLGTGIVIGATTFGTNLFGATARV